MELHISPGSLAELKTWKIQWGDKIQLAHLSGGVPLLLINWLKHEKSSSCTKLCPLDIAYYQVSSGGFSAASYLRVG